MEKNVCKDWCGEVCQNISESFKIQHKNWQRRCNCYKKHDIALGKNIKIYCLKILIE